MLSPKKYHRDSRLERNWPAILRENHEPAALADTRHNSWCLLFVVKELGAECGDALMLWSDVAVPEFPPIQRFAQGGFQFFYFLYAMHFPMHIALIFFLGTVKLLHSVLIVTHGH